MNNIITFIISLSFISTGLFATSVHVPNDYPTIQLAINYSTDIDTIIISDGVYSEDFSVHSNVTKTLISENGSENCILLGHIEFFERITIKNITFKGDAFLEYSYNGYQTEPFELINCIFTEKTDSDYPLFISIDNTNSSYNIVNCQFINNIYTNNSNSDNESGLIRIGRDDYRSGVVNIDSCIFRNNINYRGTGSEHRGCAINITDKNYDSVFVSNTAFIKNEMLFSSTSLNALGRGGAIFHNGLFMSIDNCLFFDNEAGEGVAIYSGSILKINNSTFSNNDSFGSNGLPRFTISHSGSDNATSISRCNFKNNTNALESTNINLFFDADSNYWGHQSGPNHSTSNINGQGDSISFYVDVMPFLSEPDTIAPIPVIQNVSVDTIGIDYVNIIWDNSSIGDLAGYIVYLDSIPTDVGLDTTYILNNLALGVSYNIMVTCYDNNGEESWYSNVLSVSPLSVPLISAIDSLDFGTVFIGDVMGSPLVVHNNGAAELNITNITFTTLQFDTEIETLTIPSSSQSIIPITFTPTEFGLVTATITIYSDAFNMSNLEVALLGFGDLPPNPIMLSAEDVPDDQGGQIRVSFKRSKYDGIDTTLQIESYTVWRHLDNSMWDAVGMFNAVQDSIYNYVAPTLCDSTTDSICWSTYKVSAHTDDADLFFWSDSISGYSVDNIAPSVPTGLMATATEENIQLTWDVRLDEDFQYFLLE